MARGVNRRALIRYGTLGGAAALAIPAAGAGRGSRTRSPEPIPPFELEEATIADLQKRMASGQDSARSLCEKYIARIEALDRRGPMLRAVLEINPDALAIAEGLDAERRAGKSRGPLHGIPVLLKDNIATADRMQTTAGSLALVGVTPPERRAHRQASARSGRRDPRQGEPVGVGELPFDPLLERLERARRAVPQSLRARPQPLGLELRLRRGRRGQPLRDHRRHRDGRLDRVARRTTAASSASSPRSVWSAASGIIPIAHSQDTAGPMTRTVADAAILLTALAGYDPADPATREIAGRARDDYSAYLDRKGLSGARIGVAAQEALRAEHAGRRDHREGAPRDEPPGRGPRGPGGHRDRRRGRRHRVRGAALRVQGGPERVPGGARPADSLPDARGS